MSARHQGANPPCKCLDFRKKRGGVEGGRYLRAEPSPVCGHGTLYSRAIFVQLEHFVTSQRALFVYVYAENVSATSDAAFVISGGDHWRGLVVFIMVRETK